MYALENAYPFDSVEFADAWDKESAFLSRALKAEDESDVRDSIKQFLKVRETRRIEASLKPELVAFENDLEWLEGLARYAEIRFYELAALQKNGSKFTKYKTSLPSHWKMEFRRINGKLGHLEGDYRFYLSGMAQARLLDRVRPNWKMQFKHEDSNLEDILRIAVETGEKY